MRIFFLISLLLTLLVSLLNGQGYGAANLLAFFLFLIFASFTSVISWVRIGVLKNFYIQQPPLYLSLFNVLVLYILGHGIALNNFGTTHYFWGISGLLLTSLYYGFSLTNINRSLNKFFLLQFITIGISLFAVVESVIVCLQMVGILSSLNKSFNCTGTWANPNVTAAFLGMSLFSIGYLLVRKGIIMLRVFAGCCLFLTLIGIGLLESRTAYLMTSLFIIGQFGQQVIKYVK